MSHFYPWIFEKTSIKEDSGTWTGLYTLEKSKPKTERQTEIQYWNSMKKKIPICTGIQDYNACNEKGYLCSWKSGKGKCINDPNGR